jgi:hypothetical protein
MPEDYLRVLANAACGLGNSSSFVRDASFFGTPIVLVGDRQSGRETDEHVLPVAPVRELIFEAARSQLNHGRYGPSKLYGDGSVSARIAEGLARLVPYTQKKLSYAAAEVAAVGGNGRAHTWDRHRAKRVEGNSKQEHSPVGGDPVAGLHR